MSIETWKLQFYPKAAADTQPDEALAHSLLKWQGLREENMQAHAVYRGTDRCIEDDAADFAVNSYTCALCHHFEHPRAAFPCSACPLKLVRGRPCDSHRRGRDASPWGLWLHSNDPEPMIALIEAAIRGEVHDGQ